jgi:hypothetical protein
MRDGTLLAASVTRPAGDGPFPTVLTRTPYDRTNQVLAAEMWAHAGYAFVRQDVRGRFDSDGEFYPFRDDRLDGFDTIEWVAAQPWSDGKVGTTGASHVGTVQYLAAPGRPPHLTASIPEFAPVSVYDRWWYQGGAFRLGFNLAWLVLLAGDNVRHYPNRAARLVADRDQLWVTPEQMLALDIKPLYREWSYRDYPAVEGVFGNRWFDEFMEHPRYGPFWQPYDFTLQHAEMETPMLHIGGWYDTFCQGTIDSYTGLRANARTAAAREGQRLIMGPWRHVNWGMRDVGELDFGARLLEVSPFETRKRWFDEHLRGIDTGSRNGPPVQIFVMGEDAWRAEQEWPLARAVETPLFLHTDGTLDAIEPSGEAPRTFTYDPADPVITLGGCEWVNYPCGPFDQKPLDGRTDILRFQTAPLDRDIEVTGQVFARIWASSTAVDTDITAKLIDVYPDGRAYNLCDGILRGRYRESVERETPMVPGEPYEFVVDLWSTSNLFRAGHRIRLDVSSSNFPRFDANPNTGAPPFSSGERVVARNTVYFDAAHPSRVVLPVIPR